MGFAGITHAHRFVEGQNEVQKTYVFVRLYPSTQYIQLLLFGYLFSEFFLCCQGGASTAWDLFKILGIWE